MFGQEHEVMLKAGRVATLHNGIRMAASLGDPIDDIIPKMNEALDDLLDAWFVYSEWRKNTKDAKENN